MYGRESILNILLFIVYCEGLYLFVCSEPFGYISSDHVFLWRQRSLCSNGIIRVPPISTFVRVQYLLFQPILLSRFHFIEESVFLYTDISSPERMMM
jgi:hypothetical protein